MPGPRYKALLLAILFLLGLTGGVSLYILGYQPGQRVFPAGTYVDGISLKGQTRGQAVRTIQQRLIPAAGVKLDFVLGNEHFAVQGDQGVLKLQVGQFVDSIYGAEQRRDLRDRLFNQHPRHYDLAVPVRYDRKKYDQVMARMIMEMEHRPRYARVYWHPGGGYRVRPGQNGIRIHVRRTFAALPDTYFGEEVLRVLVDADTVIMNVSDLDVGKYVALSACSSDFNAGNVNRTSNLKIAAGTLNGVVIPPGFEFSFNDCVGPRDLASGYKEAMVILKNEFTPGVGGGVCQVSSTLYGAVLQAGVKITERYNHSVRVSYVKPGMDATLAFPVKDFRFVNTLTGPVVLRSAVDGSRLTVSVLGQAQDMKKVVIQQRMLQSIPFSEDVGQDPLLPAGKTRIERAGVSGCIVETRRIEYGPDGEISSSETISTDRYAPLSRKMIVGTGKKAAAPPFLPELGQENGNGGMTQQKPIGAENTEPEDSTPINGGSTGDATGSVQ